MENNKNKKIILEYYLKNDYFYNNDYLKNRFFTFKRIIAFFYEKIDFFLKKEDLNYFYDEKNNFLFLLHYNIEISDKLNKINKKNPIIIAIGTGVLNTVFKKYDYTIYPFPILNIKIPIHLNYFKRFNNCLSIGYHTNNDINYIGFHTTSPLYNSHFNFFNNLNMNNSLDILQEKNINNYYLLNIFKKNENIDIKYKNLDYFTCNEIFTHFQNKFNLDLKEIKKYDNNYILINKKNNLFYILTLIKKKMVQDLTNLNVNIQEINNNLFDNLKKS